MKFMLSNTGARREERVRILIFCYGISGETNPAPYFVSFDCLYFHPSPKMNVLSIPVCMHYTMIVTQLNKFTEDLVSNVDMRHKTSPSQNFKVFWQSFHPSQVVVSAGGT